MSRIRSFLIIGIFILSWVSLFFITGSYYPWLENGSTQSDKAISIYLGDISNENYDRMGFTRGIVRRVENQQAWLVGTDLGELRLISDTGRQLWQRSFGVGKITAVYIDENEQVAYVGEQSPTGNLYAVNIETGDIAWQYAAADFVGADVGKKSYPAIVHIAVDKNSNVYAAAHRFGMSRDGQRNNFVRLLAINKAGKQLWQYPTDEPMDTWVNWFDISDSGQIALATSVYVAVAERKYSDTLYFIDKNSGQLLHSRLIEPIAPFGTTVFRCSPNYSADGKLLAAAASDGRAFLLSSDGEIIWQRSLSQPTVLDGTVINASGRDGFVRPEGIIFTTTNTYNRSNWQLPTPVEHPGGNSFFMFRPDGTFVYQYKAAGTMEEIGFSDNGLIACAIGRNVRTHDYKAHGALVVDIASGEKKAFFGTEGPLQAISMSRDGSRLAGIEAPATTPDGQILGLYQLHIWQLD